MKRRLECTSTDSSVNPYTGKSYSSNYYKILESRKKLPCWSKQSDFLSLVSSNQVCLLVSETGSGKTTQLPQFLLDADFLPSTGIIGCTQPRRVAAMSVAARVADEMDVRLGDAVGYSIRFDDCTSPATRLKYMTDGMLLREAMTDSSLAKYSVLLLDEAHERTLATDLLFGLIKQLLPKRPDLKVVIMSATLEADSFLKYFALDKSTAFLEITGRQFPVEINYLTQRSANYVDTAIEVVKQVHQEEDSGDILVFLTGEEEIDLTVDTLTSALGSNAQVLPLYSSLPVHQQQEVFKTTPRGVRKVVVSTNISETSVTIDGVTAVIDSGFSKQKVYNPRTRVESLLVSAISKASARQRAGRAGRTAPGQCYRLYTEEAFENMEQNTHPELIRSNLSSVVLTLQRLGVKDLVHFDWMSPPAPETLMRALEELNALKLLDDEGELTDLGRTVAEFPIDPCMAVALLKGREFGASEGVLSVVAMLSVPPVFLRPKDQAKLADKARRKFVDESSDHVTLMNVMKAYDEVKQHAVDNEEVANWCWEHFLNVRSLKAAENVREQLRRMLVRATVRTSGVGAGVKPEKAAEGGEKKYAAAVKKALLHGFFLSLALTTDKVGVYSTLARPAEAVLLHPSSVINYKPEWVMYTEFVMTSKKYIRTVTAVDGSWLKDIDTEYFKTGFFTADAQKKLHKLLPAEAEEEEEPPRKKRTRE